jgi:UDP-3-O-[3-hydroxymyristoyl] glucosamine N-acyltransferase
VANGTHLGAQSGISKSIKEEGQRIMGSPAFEFGSYFKAYAVFKKLPDIYQRLKELEDKVQTTQHRPLSAD